MKSEPFLESLSALKRVILGGFLCIFALFFILFDRKISENFPHFKGGRGGGSGRCGKNQHFLFYFFLKASLRSHYIGPAQTQTLHKSSSKWIGKRLTDVYCQNSTTFTKRLSIVEQL